MNSFLQKAGSFSAFLKNILKAFFGITEGESIAKASAKVTHTVFLRTIYGIADYWLMALSAAFIIVMDKHYGYASHILFLLMWAFDLIVANAFVVIWKKTGQDVTLGESYRRAADTIYNGSRLAGRLAFLGVVIKATFWDGPEHIVIFFHKEIKTEIRMLGILIVLTAIQAAIWTPIYVLGFDTVSELYDHIIKTYVL